jgi:hypothetical protein
MPDNGRMVVFVHGWSVQNTDTYGELPRRLAQEAERQRDLRLDVRHILLGRYVSFRDEVRLVDVSRAFQRALEQELQAEISAGQRFVCITHSTGGPVVRDWWNRFHRESSQLGHCPMSHLIMLAPANFGSALAQLGKSPGARLKTWMEGVQPGAGLLDWLELGSSESWELNRKWIIGGNGTEDDPPVFPFVLTGQSIDRHLYDHLNSYTDESGSDGVVRTAAANLNATYVQLEQGTPQVAAGSMQPSTSIALDIKNSRRAPRTAFALIPGRSHSGEDMGIIRSVKNDRKRHPTVEAVLSCLRVSNRDEYLVVSDTFAAQNQRVREAERAEIISRSFIPDAIYFHDSHAMTIFRIRDDHGYPIHDFDLTLIGKIKRRSGPDFLPKGFFVDRQKNSCETGVLTYYFSYDAMTGSPAVPNPKDRQKPKDRQRLLRAELPGADGLGLEIAARPDEGFVRYVPAVLQVSKDVLREFMKADETTLVDIVLRRVVHEGLFRLSRTLDPESFTDQPPAAPIP